MAALKGPTSHAKSRASHVSAQVPSGSDRMNIPPVHENTEHEEKLNNFIFLFCHICSARFGAGKEMHGYDGK